MRGGDIPVLCSIRVTEALIFILRTARSTGTGRIATLSDMTGSSAPVRGRTSQRPPSDEDDEEDDTQEGERWFAGGERRQGNTLVSSCLY